MEKTVVSADMDPFRSIVSKMTHEKLDCQGMSATILVTLQEIMEFVQTIVVQLEQAGHSEAVACGNGCSYCCHSRINVIPVEALLIFSLIETSFDSREIRELKAKIQKNQQLTRGKTLEERVAVKDQTPCIFLGKKGQCEIYSARPFICRSWHSFDKGACKSAFVSGDPTVQMETFEARNYMFGSARKVFEDLSVQMKLETGIYTMPQAIETCFSMAAPLTDWLAGKMVFEPA